MPIGNDRIIPKKVARIAIFIVSIIPIQAVEHENCRNLFASQGGYDWGSITLHPPQSQTIPDVSCSKIQKMEIKTKMETINSLSSESILNKTTPPKLKYP